MTVPNPQQRLQTAIKSLDKSIESIDQVLVNLDFASVIASLQNYSEEVRTVPKSHMTREEIIEFLADKFCESQPKERLNRARFVIENALKELKLMDFQLNKMSSEN